MKAIEYHMNIHSPGSRSDLLVGYRATSPFMSISQGDVIACSGFERNSTRMLRVEQVEHLLWESAESIAHKMLVYTSLKGSDDDAGPKRASKAKPVAKKRK